jgi:uncharacterized membrane protein YtjA (UPF0391 family)
VVIALAICRAEIDKLISALQARKGLAVEHVRRKRFTIIEENKPVVLALAQALIDHPERTLHAAEIDAVISQTLAREALAVEQARRAVWRRTIEQRKLRHVLDKVSSATTLIYWNQSWAGRSQSPSIAGGMTMAISKWVLLILVVSITAGLSGVVNRSSISADVAGALFGTLLIIFVVLLVLGFTVYRPE